MGKKNKYARPEVSEERTLELVQGLGLGVLEGPLSDAEVAALCDHLAGAERLDALLALRELTTDKGQRKLVDKGLYRLAQRGIEVPDLKEKPAPISLAVEPPDVSDLPVLFCAPLNEATRIVFLPWVSGRNLYYAQMRFDGTVGVDALRGAETSRSLYRAMVKQVTKLDTEGYPDFVDAGPAFAARKLWDAGRLFRTGRSGSEIDHEVREVLVFPKDPPPHPAESLDASGYEPLSVAEMYEHPVAIGVVLHVSMRTELQRAYDEGDLSVADEDIESIRRFEAIERRCAESLLDRWGMTCAREALLDAALYWWLVDSKPIAATYLEIALEPDEAVWRTRFVRFVATTLAVIRRQDAERVRARAEAEADEG